MKTMIKLPHLLFLSSFYFIFCLPYSHGAEVDHSSADKVAQEIADYLALGEVQLAYQLAQAHHSLNDKLALKFAQLSLILGKQQQAQRLFSRLEASEQLSAKQKKNMQRFIQGFNQAQKKKLKLASKMIRQGQCDQASKVLNTLLHFQQWQEKAQHQLNLCTSHKITGQVRLGYRYGWDDNIALSNEQLEQGSSKLGPNKLLAGSYQNASLYTGAKLSLNDNHQLVQALGLEKLILSPSYYFSTRQYDEQVPSQYDQASHKLQLALTAKHGAGVELSMPSYFRYSQYAGRHYSNSYGTKLVFGVSSKLGNSQNRRHIKQQLLLHWRAKNYVQESLQDKDGHLLELGYSSRYKFKDVRALAKLHWQDFSGPKEASDRYQQSILGLKLTPSLTKNFFYNFKVDAFIGLNLKYKLYQGTDADLVALYGQDYAEPREDLRQDWRAGLTFKKSQSKSSRWQIKTSVHYQERNSNLPLYDFKRKKLELVLQYSF